MSNYKTVRFKVLPDNCSTEDQLEDRTHERIADKLCEIISSEGSEGMTIGLEGEWGSGKSTVVRLLRERLNRAKKNRSFVFYIDAWEHEGDHLRRVFLETLIARLQKWPQTQKYTRSLKVINDKVTAKRATKFVTHRATLSCFGKLLAFSAIFVPVGTVMVSKLFNEVTINRSAPFHKGFCLGLAMLLAPFWVYVLEFIRFIICGLVALLKREPCSFNGWAVFDSKARVDRVKETSLSDERSSVEFSRYFDEIMGVVQNEIDRVIIIVDNLDRIEQKDAARVWSTLQAFVQNKNPITEHDCQLCKWIIVPYAQEGLRRMWGEGSEQDSSDKASRPLSFMDKCFQLRLHVPKMVISGWKSFAEKCLKEAAGELDSADVKKILDVLSWTRENLTDAPSPRQVKVYVNQVGLTCSLYGARVPLEAICFYVVKKYLCGLTDAELEKELREGTISKASLPQYENNENLAPEVAAILYGVEEERAMQILLAPTITTALMTSNNELLRQMRAIHGEIFYDVLNYIFQHPNQGEHSQLNQLPKFLGSVQKTFADSDATACGYALNALRLHREATAKQMDSMCHEDAIAVIALASADKKLVRSLAKAYALDLPKRFRRDGGITPPLNQKVEYIDTPSELVKRFGDVASAAKEPIQIPYKCFKDDGVDFSKFTAEELNELARYMSDKDVADADIASGIEQGQQIEQGVANLFVALIAHGMRQTTKVFLALKQAFEWSNGRRDTSVYSDAIWDILIAFERLRTNIRPTDEIRELVGSMRFWSFSDFPSTASLFLIAKYAGADSDEELLPAGVGNNRLNAYIETWQMGDPSCGKAIYEYCKYSNEYNWLATEASKPNRALVGSIAEAALDAKDQYLFEVDKPLGFLANLYRLVDEDHKKVLVESFISSDDRLKRLTRVGSEKFVTTPLVCRKLLMATKGRDVHNILVQRVKIEMGGMTQEEWGEAIKESNEVALLVAELEQDGVQLDLTNPFSEAFKGLVVEMIKNNVEMGVPSETLSSLHAAMKGVFHNVFASGIGDALRETKFDIATDGIKEFVLNVPKYREWIAASESQIKNLAAELAKVESIGKFSNFITIIQRCGDGLANKAEIKEIIEQPVQTMLKHEDSTVKEVGEKAAAYFGIEAAVERNAEEDEVISDKGKEEYRSSAQ